jgi:hypothetical protein
MGFEGAIVTSRKNCPAPSVSAMKQDYLEVLNGLVANINNMSEGTSVEKHEVASLNEAVATLTNLSRPS